MNHLPLFLKPFFTCYFLCIGLSTIIAQPFPIPGDSHLNAPILMCLDGYTSDMGPIGPDTNFPGLCGDLSNDDWIAFVAEANDMVLSMEVYNCLGGSNGGFGIQFGVLGVGDVCTPNEFYRVACDGGGNWNQRDFNLTGLDVGSVYYIVIDGYAKDICSYTITLDTPLQGPQMPNPTLSGPAIVQEGSVSNYSLDLGVDEYIQHNPCGNELLNCDGTPACNWEYTYTWTAPPGTIVIPGSPPTEAIVNWGTVGGEICVTIENPCIGTPIVLCEQITVVDVNGGPCTPGIPTRPGDTCADAPFLCGTALNGFCGNTSGATRDRPGNLGMELSCEVDNNQWIRFTPCDTEVHLAIETSGCQLGNSLEVAVLQTDACFIFDKIMDCQLLPASFTSSFAINNLTPGEVYYLMIDGVAGISCDYQIFVLDGISMESPEYQQTTAGFISGPTEFCPEESPVFTLTPPVCFPAFADGCPFPEELADSLRLVWHIPPSMEFVGDSIDVLSIQVTMTDTVDGAIYVTYETVASDNAFCTFGIGDCNSVPAFPVTITYNITDLPAVTICEDEVFNFCGQDYSESQTLVCPEYCGETRQELIVLPLDTIPLSVVELCEGDTYDFCGSTFSDNQSTVLYCRQGCEIFAQEIIVHPKVVNDFGVVDICPGDCYDFQGQQFCTEGTFELEIPGAFGCDETFRITLNHYIAPDLVTTTPATTCEVNSNAYQVSFEILNGVPPFTVNGLALSGNAFVSDWIANGVAYDFEIVDSDFCPVTLNIQGIFDCTSLCTTNAGTLEDINLSACGDEAIEVQLGVDAVVDFNDTYQYLLHDGDANNLGNILGSNNTGVFIFEPAIMTYSQPYFVSVIVGNESNGVVDTDDACHQVSEGLEVIFYELPLASATAQGTITCTELSSLVSAGPVISGATYSWTGPGGFTSDQAEFFTDVPGLYELLLTSPDGCSITSNATVLENREAPILSAGDDGELNCTDIEIELNGSLSQGGSDIDFFWQTNTGNFISGEQSLNPLVDAPGIYYLYAVNRANGCESTDSVLVVQNEDYPESVDLDIVHPNCFGEFSGAFTVVNVNGGEAPYLFALDQQALSTNPVFNQLSSGTYDLLVQDVNGCELSTSVTINQPQELVVDLGEDQYVGLGDLVNIAAVTNFDPDSMSWTISGEDSMMIDWERLDYSFQAMYNQRISLTLYEASGCATTDEVNVYVNQQEEVFIPNAFSPNGDGDNDYFTIFSGNDVELVKSLMVFSRWGDVVYEQRNFGPNDLSYGWDGTQNGKALNDGVFVYKAELELINGRTKIYSGDLLLVR